MKYNLHYKQKRWIATLALEAETAISLLPTFDQDPIRYQVNKNIQHLFRSMKKQPYKHNREYYESKFLKNIKEKLENNKETIIKADTGNSIVVTYLETYYDKIQAFIDDNNFTHVGSDPTKKYQRVVRASINRCPHVIPVNAK